MIPFKQMLLIIIRNFFTSNVRNVKAFEQSFSQCPIGTPMSVPDLPRAPRTHMTSSGKTSFDNVCQSRVWIIWMVILILSRKYTVNDRCMPYICMFLFFCKKNNRYMRACLFIYILLVQNKFKNSLTIHTCVPINVITQTRTNYSTMMIMIKHNVDKGMDKVYPYQL